MVDVKALFDKMQYATYGADSTALVYAAYKYILKSIDDALHEIENE